MKGNFMMDKVKCVKNQLRNKIINFLVAGMEYCEVHFEVRL